MAAEAANLQASGVCWCGGIQWGGLPAIRFSVSSWGTTPDCMISAKTIAANRLMRTHPDGGAIVFACTNMPPYAIMTRHAIGVPVFDAVTPVHYAHSLLAQPER